MQAVFPMKTTHVCSLFGTGSDAKTMCHNSSQRSGLKSLFPFAIEFKWTKKVRIEGGTQEPTTFLEVLNGILRATTSASWPLLAPSGCHLGGLGVCILILWEAFFISGARWGSFWQLGATLGDHGSSKMDMRWSGTWFLSILGWFWNLFIIVFWIHAAQNFIFFRAWFQKVFL